ncbi:MAG TPA: replication protein RepA [Gemmataceae bacterium]|nr:replication protein RepA [Gemmataceae bacterium]
MTTTKDVPAQVSLTPGVRRILDAATAIQGDPAATEIAFMARALVQATLPHSDPGDVPLWGRTNGRLTLSIKPDWELDPNTGKARCVGIPYGTIPRLLLFWITTEAVQTKQRRLELGNSLSAFMRELRLIPTGGRWGTIPRLREQMNRLFRAKISFDVNQSTDTEHGTAWMDMNVAPRGELWWSPKQPHQTTLWKSWIELGETFFNAICSSPVPVDMRALHALKRSPLALDLYAWTTYRSFTLRNNASAQFIPWRSLMQQMGSDYSDLDNFRKKVKATLRRVRAVSPHLKIEFADGGLILYPGRPAVAPRRAVTKRPVENH